MHVTFGEVHYNDRDERFEARVDVHRRGVTYRYPCSLRGPASLDDDKVRLGLAQQAMRMSDTTGPVFTAG